MSVERLQAHYGFTRTPFGRDLAPGMLHRHGAHAEAVARIGWCISERGLGVITGEVGAGKTVAVRAALAGLDPARHTIIYLGNPAVGGRGIYACIVTALGGVPPFHAAADPASHRRPGRGTRTRPDHRPGHRRSPPARRRPTRRHPAADQQRHGLPLPVRRLLVGQPTLRRRIKLGTFAALDQRIALRYAMPAMTAAETGSYISHHLALAGRSDPLFSDDATALIHQTSRGLPRAVNNLAVQALVAAYAANKAIVDESAARAAVTEVTSD